MSNGINFFQALLSSIFGGNDPDAVKRRLLKSVAKSLSRTKFHFYKISSKEVEPAFAKFFYDIYKAISPAQAMFQNMSLASLKQVVISSSLSDKQHSLLADLSEESIRELANSVSAKDLQKQVSATYSTFAQGFTSQKTAAIDVLYSKLVAFYNFCMYDFYVMIRKFDPSLHERNFSILPKFRATDGDRVEEELKNFTSVAWAIPMDATWEEMFELLKKIKGVEPIAPNIWKKIIARLRSVKDENVFEMMIQLITEDPLYREKVKVENQHIMDGYLQEIKRQMESVLEDVKEQEEKFNTEKLVQQVFGTLNVEPLKNYNEEINEVLDKKSFKGYKYAEPVKYLKLFLLDYAKKEIRDLSDIILVRGEWTNQQMSTPMSEALHRLLNISDAILKFDEKLAENGEWGMKIKTLLPRCERDKEARNIINMVIGDANDEAAQLISGAVKYMVIYDRNLKTVLEDFMKAPHSQLIVNWSDLDRFSEGTLKNKAVSIYKTIYTFVQLMQLFNVQLKTSPRY
ncbi:MAG TPA: hypothetical protein DCP61_00525 [Treponema sp.]|nr:hypothetical protein [Treponema sp.]